GADTFGQPKHGYTLARRDGARPVRARPERVAVSDRPASRACAIDAGRSVMVSPAGSGEQAAGLVQVDRAAGRQARGEPVRLLPVVKPLRGGGGAVRVDLARVVQRAHLAVVVTGVVDAHHLAGGHADDGRTRRAVAGVAALGEPDRVVPGPPVLAQGRDEPRDVAVEDPGEEARRYEGVTGHRVAGRDRPRGDAGRRPARAVGP